MLILAACLRAVSPQACRKFPPISSRSTRLQRSRPLWKLANKRVSMASAFGHGMWSFLKHYIFKRGFIDGWAGFVIAFGNLEGTFYRYAKRYEAAQNWTPPASEPLTRETPL